MTSTAHFSLLQRIQYKIQQLLLFLYLKVVLESKKTYFVYFHLPRTAGTSIQHAAYQQGYASRILVLPHVANATNTRFHNKNIIKFGTIRNPFSWYVSLYRLKTKTLLSGKIARVKDYATMEENSFDDFFSDLVLFANGLEGIKKWNKPWKPGTINTAIAKQYCSKYGFLTNLFLYYFADPRAEQEKDISVDELRTQLRVQVILPVEKLEEGLRKLLFPHDVPLVLEERLRASPKDETRTENYYTPAMRKAVYERDHLIFQLFYPHEIPL